MTLDYFVLENAIAAIMIRDHLMTGRSEHKAEYGIVLYFRIN